MRQAAARRARIAGGCALLLFTGCATLPQTRPERALYFDLRKTVEAGEDGGWIVDRVQLQRGAEPALHSVCQATKDTRDQLGSWLDLRIQEQSAHPDVLPPLRRPADRCQAGDAAAGKPRMRANSEALSLQRTRMMLQYAEANMATDCPSWLDPVEDFTGVQSDDERWVLFAETHGFASYVVNTRVPAVGGGGRILFGRGVSTTLTFVGGGELSAGGAFIPSGMQGQGLDGTFFAAVPLVLRFSRFSHIFDFEMAPVVRVAKNTDVFPPGIRAQFGGGFNSLRGGAFMPYYMLYAGYEFYPPNHGHADHQIVIGTRLAVDWAL